VHNGFATHLLSTFTYIKRSWITRWQSTRVSLINKIDRQTRKASKKDTNKKPSDFVVPGGAMVLLNLIFYICYIMIEDRRGNYVGTLKDDAFMLK
jgi:hypothetical protein